jgi:hypothetical protein
MSLVIRSRRERTRLPDAAVLLMVALGFVGCAPEGEKASLKRPTTDKVSEFDPAAGQEVVTPEVKITNPITGALEAYEPIVQKLAGLGIDQAVGHFQALEGRYPNSYDEFMTSIIKANNIQLPGLPAGLEYQYDVENHKLKIVRTAPPADAPNK